MNPTFALLPTLPQPLTEGQAYVFSTLIEMVSGPDGSWTLQPTELGREVLDLMAERDELRAVIHTLDQAGAEAIEANTRDIIAAKWNSTAEWQARALAAEAALEEAREAMRAAMEGA